MSVESKLHKAIQNGNLQEVKDYFENKRLDINHLNGMRGTPLCAAISSDQEAVVRYLIQAKCDVNAKDFDSEPPLCLAIRKQHKNLAELLIKSSSIDLNQADSVTGRVPLGLAVQWGDCDLIQLLVQHGCDINKRDEKGNTPIHLSIHYNQLNSMQQMLSHGCKINIQNNDGYVPIHMCAQVPNIDFLQTLLEFQEEKQKENKTINISKENDKKQTNGLIACPEKHKNNGRIKEINDDYIVDIDKMHPLKGSALHLALSNPGNLKHVELLIKYGISVNASCDQDAFSQMICPPLHLSCTSGLEEHTLLLLRNGADPNQIAVTMRGAHFHMQIKRMPCMHALVGARDKKTLCLLRHLVDYGANLNLQDEAGRSILMYALHMNRPEIVKYLLNEGIQKGLIVNTFDKYGTSPLFAVNSCVGAKEITAQLIDLGCDVNHQDSGRQTPLTVAIELDSEDVVEVLVEHGADLNVMLDDCPPLHMCIFNEQINNFKTLVRHGADVYINVDGNKVLMVAMNAKCFEAARFLLDTGYNVTSEMEYISQRAMHYEGLSQKEIELLDDEEENEEEFVLYAKQILKQPHLLQTQCITAIRKHLVENNLQILSIDQLPLPIRLKDRLLFKNM